MCVKKQIPSLCQLKSFYEEKPEGVLDDTDVDSCFFHNTFDIFQSQHRLVRNSKGSNRKSFVIKLIHFCDVRKQQRYIVQEEVNISKRELSSLADSLPDFVKTFAKVRKCLKIPLLKPKTEVGSTK